MGKRLKVSWDKCSLKMKQWIIIFLVSIEAALFFRFIIPMELKMDYGKSMVHLVNLFIHWIIFIPILNKFFIKGE